MYYFLRDAANSNGSAAEQEWLDLDTQYPREMVRLLRHVQRVEAAGSLSSWPLHQAQLVTATPRLYWWDVGGVGSFYHYDGVDLVIVLVGAVADPPPPSWQDLLSEAQRRL